MFVKKRPASAAILGLALLMVGNTGCRGRTEEDYNPSEANARAAVEKALTAWKDGRSAKKIAWESGTITADDWEWNKGELLAGFNVVRAEAMEGVKCFVVRLTLVSNPEPKEVRYMVRGIDPVWVFREENFKDLEGS